MISRAIEQQIVQKYHNALRRIMFLDYDGTLVPLAHRPETAVPDEPILDRLRRLAREPRNTLVVISGRDREFLEQWFGALPVGLVAEHGAFVRMASSEWVCQVNGDSGWKGQVLPMFQRYVDRCAGAFLEEKTLSLAWHYRNADPGLSQQCARELREELRELVSRPDAPRPSGPGAGLQVLEGHKVIEVKTAGYDKGTVAVKLLASAPYDFILAVGDDRTDEDLFHALPAEALTVKVGITASLAKYNLKDQQGVVRLMDRLLAGILE